ncbi:iron-containing alcohol dehydrogenase [Desulfovibrio mangrovi]|uniref:iron-containing alcohol dehydrogenase n=1 Tax=Desulfovibrio mangrovi TaxID=2976983 RepID=UPI0022467A9A|nr:iron-containing alcohol dehydrogenase [Desulfovibrio mangrovi]UZP69099.1 iron-containing alcohol dehydrogenase [Desulfovibrio mangrovi]
MINFLFHMPTRIIFGPGKLKELGTTPYLPGKKALLVISAGGSMVAHGYMQLVQTLLAQNGAESVVFDRIQANPVLEHVAEGAALARTEGCDFVIGLGGGSSIDAAKAIALMVTNSGSYWDYMPSGTGGRQVPAKPALPIVAIPTTAGTGTEADPWIVITREQTNEKIGWGNDSTYPVLSIVDPKLTLSVPPRVTAMTGMDAFFHAVEAYLSHARQPTSDLLAQQAVSLISSFLPQVVQNGDSIEARTMLSWASTAAGVCESLSSCISHHSMEHALSAYYPEIPHGAGLVMLSVPYFRYLTRYVPDRMIDLAYFMGVDVDSLPANEQPFAFVGALEKLIKDIGLDDLKFSDYGVHRDEMPTLAANAQETMGGLFNLTPTQMNLRVVTEIFEAAYR